MEQLQIPHHSVVLANKIANFALENALMAEKVMRLEAEIQRLRAEAEANKPNAAEHGDSGVTA